MYGGLQQSPYQMGGPASPRLQIGSMTNGKASPSSPRFQLGVNNSQIGAPPPNGAGGGTGEYMKLLTKYNELLNNYQTLMKSHSDLMTQHIEAIKNQANMRQKPNPGKDRRKNQDSKSSAPSKSPSFIPNPASPQTTYVQSNAVQKCQFPTLGVVRLDYNYPPIPGDIDCPETFTYDVFYRVVPGLTFEMCQAGDMTREVQKNFADAIKSLQQKGVKAITGDCGFMMYFQDLARNYTAKPVFMSSLAQLPAVTCGFDFNEKIAIFTANGKSLEPMMPLIKAECGVDPDEERYIFVGCEDVPGFEAVAAGGKVDAEKVTPGMVEKAKKVIRDNPDVKAILMECTELPAYSDALRQATGLPVYDAITCCDFFMTGYMDNPNFGKQGWQQGWDGKQDAYTFGQNVVDKSMLINRC